MPLQKPEKRIDILNLPPGEPNWVTAGYFGRPTAPENALVLKLLSPLAALPPFIFTLEDGFMVPWRLHILKTPGKEKFIVRLKGVDHAYTVARFQGRPWWLPAARENEEFEKPVKEHSLLGYSFLDHVSALEGEVTGEEGDEKNPLLRVKCMRGSFTLPRNAGFILKVDHKARKIEAQLPEDYLDVFLS